jgi:uncharacterized protein YkwD
LANIYTVFSTQIVVQLGENWMFIKRIVLLVLLLGSFSLPVVADISREENTDRPGMDYNTISLDTPDVSLCDQACQDDDRCMAYTYVKPGVQGRKANCWLKSGVPNPVSSKDCISGVKNENSALLNSKEEKLPLDERKSVSEKDEEGVSYFKPSGEKNLFNSDLISRSVDQQREFADSDQKLPDLKPVKIEVPSEIKGGDKFPVSIYIENSGLADAGPSKGQLTYTWKGKVTSNPDGTQSTSGKFDYFPDFSVGSISKGSNTKVTEMVSPPLDSTSSGTLFIAAKLNQAQTIQESDYSNNGIESAVITVVVPGPAQLKDEELVADAVFTKTNIARSNEGKPLLKRNKDIDAIALSHSTYLAKYDKDGHENVDSRSTAIKNLGFHAPAENVFRFAAVSQVSFCDHLPHTVTDTPESIAEYAVDVFVNHDSCNGNNNLHRDNLLNPKYTDVGIGVAKNGIMYYLTMDLTYK